MLEEALELCARGFAVHWLHPRSKRPIGEGWQFREKPTVDSLKKTYREGANIGFRPGAWSKIEDAYLHVIDLDVRDEDRVSEAKDALLDLLPELDLDECPTVMSGSGGASRHFFFFCDKPFNKRVIAKSADKVLVDGKKKHVWQVELYGSATIDTGQNIVLPPSIHPDTGNPYKWMRPFDWDNIELFGPTVIPAEAVERAVGLQGSDGDEIEQTPIGLSAKEVADYLRDYPNTDLDYDEWLEVATAVQHECSQKPKKEQEDYFEVFRKWSAKSNKHDDKVARHKFFSFRNPQNRLLKTFRYVRSMVNDVRIDRALDDEFDEEFGDDEADTDDIDEEFEDEFGLDREISDIDYSVDDEEDDVFGDLVQKQTTLTDNQKRKQAKRERDKRTKELGGDAPKWVRRINEKHAVARIQGKTVILDFQYDGKVAYGNATDLHTWFEDKRMNNLDGKSVPISRMWIQNHFRRSYPNGIVFLPNQTVPGAFNHWQGFSVEESENKDPVEGCKMFLKHLREVVCGGNDAHYYYALRYWAHMIQKPEDKPGVAFVVKGKKGAGKDTVAEYVGKLIEHHYVTIGNQDQLTGKFNRHQERCLLLHVQEGYWAGSKRDESALKYLITSPDVSIEPKGVDAFQVRSVLRIFISSNERWVVPASEDERRYFVLNVSERRRGDHTYFNELRKEMRGDGPSSLLAYLKQLDLTGFEVRNAPDTDALAEQKAQGLCNVERWWHDVLQHADFKGVDPARWSVEQVEIPRDELREQYSNWMRTRRYDGEEVGEIEFGRRMVAMMPSLSVKQRRQKENRFRSYVVPPLDRAREEFEAYLGSSLAWPEDELRVTTIETEEEDDL